MKSETKSQKMTIPDGEREERGLFDGLFPPATTTPAPSIFSGLGSLFGTTTPAPFFGSLGGGGGGYGVHQGRSMTDITSGMSNTAGGVLSGLQSAAGGMMQVASGAVGAAFEAAGKAGEIAGQVVNTGMNMAGEVVKLATGTVGTVVGR
jgi:hypothetical protein